MRLTPIALLVSILLFSPRAQACLRAELDARAVQWSTQIIEAKLVEVSERIEIKAISVKVSKELKAANPGARPGDITAVYWYRLYSFEVQSVLEGSAKPKHRIEVIRFFGKVDDPTGAFKAPAFPVSPCTELLTRASIGKSFILLLRPEQDVKMDKPPIWSDPKSDLREKEVHDVRGQWVVHMMAREKADDAAIASLKKLIADTRSAERKRSDPDLKKHVETIVTGKDPAKVEAAAAALRGVGFRAVSRLKSARDAKESTDEIKSRLLPLIAELSPPVMQLQMDAHKE